MFMKTIYALLVVFTIICWSCHSSPSFRSCKVECNAEDIDLTSALSNEKLTIDDLLDSMYIVALETSSNSILSSVKNIILGDQYIYILDNYGSGGVAIFYRDGRFLKRLSHGDGPGEIERATSIAFDKYNQRLLVNNNRRISIFNHTGEFVKNVDPGFIFGDFIALQDYYLFYQYDFQNLETNMPSFIVTDTLFQIKETFYLEYKRYVMGSRFLSYSDCENEIIFSRPLDNSIYTINLSGEIDAKYNFVYRDLEADLDKYDYCRDNTFFLETEKNQKGKVYYSGDFAETDNYLYLRFNKLGEGDVYMYINKISNEIRSGIDPFIQSYLLPNKGVMIGNYGNFFAKYLPLEFFGGISAIPKIIESNKPFLSEDDLAKLVQYKEDDNPILFFYKLK